MLQFRSETVTFPQDRFVAAVTEKVSKSRVDQGLQDELVVGPTISQAGYDKVSELVENARKSGATVALGGKAHDKGGLVYEPTILTDVNDHMALGHLYLPTPAAISATKGLACSVTEGFGG